VPHNKKEAALVILDENDYSVSNLYEKLSMIDPIDGSDWSREEKDKFHAEIFRLRKDMRGLSHSMNKKMRSILAYYLGTFKKSDHYRLLKTVCVEERNEKAASSVHGVDACAICGDGGSLLICDGCEGEYHTGCLRPPLQIVPEGNWDCDECVDQKFLAARDYIIRHAGLYERVDISSKKRKADDQQSPDLDDEDELLFRPPSPVLKVMKAFAISISKTLSGAQSIEPTCTNNSVEA
jgi:hypothetical protein